jgi:hypothetical protein
MPMDKNTATAQVAKNLGIPTDWLDKLIQFESGWNPTIANKHSSAKGLIQFTDSTAQSLGFSNSQDLINKNPDIISQLVGPVNQYLNQFKPFPTPQSLYMSVFYPAARSWSPDTMFPDTVRAVNPGITYVSDYVNRVNHAPLIRTAINVSGLAVIALSTILAYQVIIHPYIKRKVDEWTPKEQIEVIPPEEIETTDE